MISSAVLSYHLTYLILNLVSLYSVYPLVWCCILSNLSIYVLFSQCIIFLGVVLSKCWSFEFDWLSSICESLYLWSSLYCYSWSKYSWDFYTTHSNWAHYHYYVYGCVWHWWLGVSQALAMGKWVICPRHPSNSFFEQFSNCLMYNSIGRTWNWVSLWGTNHCCYIEEFGANINWAMTNNPTPLTAEQNYLLSWEAATDR